MDSMKETSKRVKPKKGKSPYEPRRIVKPKLPDIRHPNSHPYDASGRRRV
jgi:hypothetical protein